MKSSWISLSDRVIIWVEKRDQLSNSEEFDPFLARQTDQSIFSSLDLSIRDMSSCSSDTTHFPFPLLQPVCILPSLLPFLRSVSNSTYQLVPRSGSLLIHED
ncbi:hypothetical protein Tco_0658149 [Tanacetum coccineum]